MKRYISLLSLFLAGMAPGLNAQTEQTASTVWTARELPRTRTLSYNSEKNALAGGVVPSLYIQPLAQWKQTADRDGNTVFSTTYKVPFQWIDRQQFIHIDAVSGSYAVSVNDEPAGYNQSSRTAAEFDITAPSVEGVNTLSITVFADGEETALSRLSATGGRIMGNTYILSQPRVRIRDFVTSVNLDGDNTNIELGVIVKTHLLNPKTIRVHYALTAPDGTPGPYGHRDATLDMRGEDTIRFFVTVPDPKHWSHETPNLYTMTLRLQQEGRYTEYQAHKIGLRTAEAGDGTLMVNGFEIPLSIAEYTATGDVKAVENDLRKFKNDGINTIKVSGAPQPEYFYDLCDAIGLYVCNQADIDTRAGGTSRKTGGNPSNDPRWEESYIDRVMTMYHTSQNHPSVIMFSIADNSANGYNLYESYLALKSVERSRPVIYTGAAGEWNSDAVDAGVRDRAAAARFVFDKTIAAATREPVAVSVTDGASGRFSVTNNFASRHLDPATVIWQVRQGNKLVSNGVSQISLPPGASEPLRIDYGRAKAGRSLSVIFTIYRKSELFDSASPAAGAASSKSSKSSKKTPAALIKTAGHNFEIPY